jgi:hypothetical protein
MLLSGSTPWWDELILYILEAQREVKCRDVEDKKSEVN